MAHSPDASPVASSSRDAAGTGPRSRTASASVGPATYAVASHGTSASRSAATTGVVNTPFTRRAAATSDRNRGSAATSAPMTRTATRSPLGARLRNSPLPPSGSSSWYGPTDVSGTTTLNPHSQWQLQLLPRISILSNDPHCVYATKAPQDRDGAGRPAMTRPAATRNDFGTVRAYGWARSGRISDEVRGILSRGGD